MIPASLITVILPTYNRADVLRLCLDALERQSLSKFEVIVVNDGATDGTAQVLTACAAEGRLRLKVLTQTNAGPARARNLALAHTLTPFALLIGDDILASPTFVESHLDYHLRNPGEDRFALGLTRWDEVHQEITPFMRWYENIQFDYGSLLAGVTPTWRHAYTSNLSFKTVALQRNKFDERFRAAAWEDSELAFRLVQQNCFQLEFLREATATHVHPTTFLQAARRMETLGKMEKVFHEIHPESQTSTPADARSRICAFLGRHPELLGWITSAVDRLARPGKLQSMVLRGHHQLAYLNSPTT